GGALMSRPLIIGFGNPLREDDGIGCRAAELVQCEDADADVITCRQLTPELAEAVSGASMVVFLDASVSQAAGTVAVSAVTQETSDAWSHDLAPAMLTGLAQRTYGAAPAAFMISGGVAHLGWGEKLTSSAERCAMEMAAEASRLLRTR
ncbi:MAG TPA: hydrogenase maturation protease, partial [Bryobacteraceae bacterium]|nr:hydrogenase maturation protease [Bryobacteraceae bacterium]